MVAGHPKPSCESGTNPADKSVFCPKGLAPHSLEAGIDYDIPLFQPSPQQHERCRLSVLPAPVDDEITAIINIVFLYLFQPVIQPDHVMALRAAGACHIKSPFHKVHLRFL